MSPNAQAYGWYVLAKAGLADAGRVRYFQDTKGGDISGGLAWAQLAAALNQVGEPGRARLAFGLARQHIDQRDPSDYYGSALRDRAALLALAHGGRRPRGAAAEVATPVREQMVARVEYTTTQEQAWLVLAAHAMAGGGELAYSVDGEPRKSATEPVVINPDAGRDRARRARDATRASGRSGCRSRRAACRTSRSPPPSQGLSVRPEFYTLDGKPADLAQVRQNERLIVSIERLQ